MSRIDTAHDLRWEVFIVPTHPGTEPTPGWSNALAVRGGIPPPLTSLIPATAIHAGANFTLRCLGAGFSPGAVIVWNGTDQPTTFVSEGEVTTPINNGGSVAGPVPVLVRNNQDRSAPVTFTLT